MKIARVCLGQDNKPYRLVRAAMQRTGEEVRLPVAYTRKRVRFQTKVFAEVEISPKSKSGSEPLNLPAHKTHSGYFRRFGIDTPWCQALF